MASIRTLKKMEEYLSSRYNFRYNVVTSKVEYEDLAVKRPKEVDDYLLNSLLRELRTAKIAVSKLELVQTLQSDFVEVFDPFIAYFYNVLPPWDGQFDYIKALADTVTVCKEEQEQWYLYLRKWLIGVVACATNQKDVNQSVLVFLGSQGIGKTKWMNKLVPDRLLKYYYSGNINPCDKDSKIQIAECLLINLDELEDLSRSNIGSLKQLITQSSIRIRRPYAAVPENMPRRASFMGSVNSSEFLKDSTGNRRFLCIEALKIDYDHSIDMDKVYAQARHLLQNGTPYWFNQEENVTINQVNEKYRASLHEIELVNEHFQPCLLDTEPDLLLTATELQRYLLKQGGLMDNLNFRRLCMALKASTYTRTKVNGSWKWKLKHKQKEQE